jgi:hypothetical protein
MKSFLVLNRLQRMLAEHSATPERRRETTRVSNFEQTALLGTLNMTLRGTNQSQLLDYVCRRAAKTKKMLEMSSSGNRQ